MGEGAAIWDKGGGKGRERGYGGGKWGRVVSQWPGGIFVPFILGILGCGCGRGEMGRVGRGGARGGRGKVGGEF